MAQPVIEISDILDRARSRADMVDSGFWTDPELMKLAEQRFKKFYLTVVAKYDEFFSTYSQITVASGVAATQVVNAQVLKFRALRRQIDGANLRKADILELDKLVGYTERGRPRYYYWRVDPTQQYPSLVVAPTPDAAYTLDFYYVPMLSLQQLNSSLVQTTLYMLAGWDEYMVVDLAIAMKDREESDCSILLADRLELYNAMERQLAPTDMAEPAAVIQHGARAGQFIDDPYYGDPEPF